MSVRRVAIIGAGASGLTAIRCCLEQGLDPVCFERANHIGGLWYYTEDAVEGQACVMKSTVINTSKEMMCYSDFPIPKDFANYMHNTKVLEYFDLYADKFHLRDAIRFKTEILTVKRAGDFLETGRWELQIKDLNTGEVWKETFDAVLVCTGHHAEKNMPTFPGLGDFQGKIVHTHDYKDHLGYEDKRVVVVGIGNSGTDVAVELGRVSEQVFHSTRHGAWILNRVDTNGIPGDLVFGRRIVNQILGLLPKTWLNSIVEGQLNKKFDHSLYGLKPKHRFLAQHPTVSDDLPNRIICGSIKVKPDVKRITKTGVEFEDGTFEDNIDVIILATGYIFGFPFIDKDVIDVQDNRVNLFKYVFPPDLEHPTLAVIGCFQPLGAIMPLSEMQCRWATLLWKGEVQLPSRRAMLDDIQMKQEVMAKRYVVSKRHTIQVDYIDYMDELAKCAECKPDLKRLFLTDPVLAWKCWTEPCTPYQYRLHGPNPWPGAREAIMTQWNRIFCPLRTRKVDEEEKPSSLMLLVVVFVILAIIIRYFFY